MRFCDFTFIEIKICGFSLMVQLFLYVVTNIFGEYIVSVLKKKFIILHTEQNDRS